MRGSFIMDEREICHRYRRSPDKEEIISVLSELNDCSMQTIVNILVAGGYEAELTQRQKNTEEVIKLHSQGKTDAEMARIIGIPEDLAVKIRARYDLPVNRAIPDLNSELTELYEMGMVDREIGEKLNISHTRVWRWRKREGLKPNYRRLNK